MRTFTRVNLKIKVPNVRCIRSDGSMAGVIPTNDARRMAIEEGLDLVEVSPNADPPVCRIMDYGKFKYTESVKQKKARKQSTLHNRAIKEVKFHPNVAEHDFQTKLNHIRGFLTDGHKVKLTLQFRGREHAHQDIGFGVMRRAVAACEDCSSVEMSPKLIGRNIGALLAPRVPGKVAKPAAASRPPAPKVAPVASAPTVTPPVVSAPVVPPPAREEGSVEG